MDVWVPGAVDVVSWLMTPLAADIASEQWRVGAALAIGLLMGAERERHKGTGPGRAGAGVRTFALVSLMGGVAAWFDATAVLVLAGAFVGALAIAGHVTRRSDDPGLTTEVALLLAFLLGALTRTEPQLAAAVGVAATILLSARHRLHRFVRDVVTDDELRDVLTLAAAAVVVLPLVPDRGLGPGGSLNPFVIWRLAVLVLAVSLAGHVGVRILGRRYGLAVTGIASAFVSGIATIATMGSRVRREPELLRPAASGAILSNLSTLILTVAIVGAASPGALASLALPLGGAALAIAAIGAAGLRHSSGPSGEPPDARAFDLRAAAAIVVALTLVVTLAAALSEGLGARGVVLAAGVTGLGDSQAAAAAAAAVHASGGISEVQAASAILAGLTTNTLVKGVVAAMIGGRNFLAAILPALAALVVVPWGALWLAHIGVFP